MKTKKILSLAMALSLALSLAVPAFADGTNTTTVFNATYTAPVINVTVPQTATVTLNPLGLEVDSGTAKDTNDATLGNYKFTGDQIVTLPACISNESSMDLDVAVSVSTEIVGDTTDTSKNMKLATSEAALQDDEGNELTSKSAFVVFQAKNMTSGTETFGSTSVNAQELAKAATDWKYDAETTTDENDAIVGTNCVVLNASKTVTGTKLVTLAKKNASTGNYSSGGVAVVRLSGKMIQSPKIAWSSDDGLKATVTFTFTPGTYVKPTT